MVCESLQTVEMRSGLLQTSRPEAGDSLRIVPDGPRIHQIVRRFLAAPDCVPPTEAHLRVEGVTQ